MSPATKIDAVDFRRALGRYASGLTVISGSDEAGPIGFTCQSFYSVSMEPPLISFSVMKSSSSYPKIRDTGKFAVNILSEVQESVANQFARGGDDKWVNIVWKPTAQNNPVIDGSLGWLDRKIWAEHDAGDHVIVIGQVHEIHTEQTDTAAPLVYFDAQYRTLANEARVL